MNIHSGYRKLNDYKGASCGQHSALSTQHSALSTQHSALSVHQSKTWFVAILLLIAIFWTPTASAAVVYKCIDGIFHDSESIETEHIDSNPLSACNRALDAHPEIYPRTRTEIVSCFTPAGQLVTGTTVETFAIKECTPAAVQVGDYWGACRIRYTYAEFCTGLPDRNKIIDDQYGTEVRIIKTPTLIGFFNGVANTEKEGRASLDILKTELPTTPGKPTEYELFYNQSGCKEGVTGKVSCLQDVAEVFEQRSTELSGVLGNRWEVFWEILAGKHQQPGSLTSTLLSRLVDTASALFGLIDSIFSNVITRFASAFTNILSLINSPPTVADKEAHLATLKTYADKRYGMVLVAHSQGNLFVNAAYDSIKASHPSVKAEVVHVAPASPTLRGGYGLADIDLVINALRLTGVTSVPPNNILGMPTSKDDMTGHSFASTYMDKVRAAYTDIKAKLTAAFELASQ